MVWTSKCVCTQGGASKPACPRRCTAMDVRACSRAAAQLVVFASSHPRLLVPGDVPPPIFACSSDNARTSRLVALAAARALPWSCRRPARRLDNLDLLRAPWQLATLVAQTIHALPPTLDALNLFCQTLHGRLQPCQRPRSIAPTPTDSRFRRRQISTASLCKFSEPARPPPRSLNTHSSRPPLFPRPSGPAISLCPALPPPALGASVPSLPAKLPLQSSRCDSARPPTPAPPPTTTTTTPTLDLPPLRIMTIASTATPRHC